MQGNFVSKEAASQMQVGMSRAQVRQLLGTPLLADMFHADRWDYVFYFKRGSTNVVQQRDFIVLFAGDRVASWSGGEDLPSNLELLAEIDGDKRGKKAAVPNVASSAAGASAPVAAAAPVTVDTTRSPSVEVQRPPPRRPRMRTPKPHKPPIVRRMPCRRRRAIRARRCAQRRQPRMPAACRRKAPRPLVSRSSSSIVRRLPRRRRRTIRSGRAVRRKAAAARRTTHR